jgi:PAS domain S-box-containing protein
MAEGTPKSLPLSSDGESRFQLLVQAVTDYAIFMLDPNGIVLSWNPGAERTKGYRTDEIIGQSFFRFFTPEDQAAGKPQRALKTAAETGRFEDEGWRVRKDGTRFWAFAVLKSILGPNGELLGFAKVTRDMTERRAAQEALRESEQRFRLLVQSVVDYAIFMLDTQGRITNWNAGAERLKGYTFNEIVNQHFSVFYTEEDRRAGAPAKALATAIAEGRFEAEGWRVRKDGTRFWANVIIDPIRDETGALIGFAKITRDITERRALEQAKEQLYQAQKMETVGQLTGGVAHDFNNLLTAVTGSLSLISQMTDDSRIRRLAETAQRAATRGAKLTEQLLAFARKQTFRVQTSNLNEQIKAFETLLYRAVSENIALKLDLEPQLWFADVDQAQFQSAVLNLVVNSRDAMPDGGTLTIETRNVAVDADHAATLTEIAPGAYVMVAVRDTGEGMTPEVKSRAIEPFYTTKDVGKGSGLGLSQVYGFARQSEGQIDIESQPGRGTTIGIYLPRSLGTLDENAERHGTTALRGAKAESVLLVEDDPDVLDIALETLQSLGYKVYSARNASEALTILQRDVPIDVLFTDVIMPKGMNGIELAHAARRVRPTLRVLLASGYARDTLQSEAGVAEDLEFIGKPYQLPELAEKLRMLMGAG